jgi:LPXTG-motif cell wall-anchored protein
VFWQVSSSATLDTTTTFVGTIMALTDINLKTGATISGRALARNGQVTMQSNQINRPVGCDTPTVAGPTVPTPAPSATPRIPHAGAVPTGGDGAPWIVAAIVMLLAGGGVVTVATRRRRP